MASLGGLLITLGFKMNAEALDAAKQKLAALSEKARDAGKDLNSFGKKLQGIGKAATVAITLPVVGAAVAIGKLAGDFDSQMRQVEAVAGATSAELAAMREQAIQLGGSTQFSASEAAAGMIEFSKAGLNASQVLKAIGPALDFAAASGLELGRVAEITADSMSQFGLDADKATYISDVFSKAADASTTGVEELSQAMIEAAPYARVLGVDIKETATLLAAMANAGIKGSKAGTGLKNGFIGLVDPTAKAEKALKQLGITKDEFLDKSGTLKIPFTDLLERLSKTGMSVAQGVDIFGRESAGAMLSLINDFSKVEKVATSMQDLQGNSAKQAAIKMAGFNGSIKGLNSALETLAIRIGESGVLEFMEKMVKLATKIVSSLSSLNPELLKWGSILAAVAATLGALTFAMGTAVIAFGWFKVAAIGAFAKVGAAALTMWGFITGPIFLIGLAIAAAIALIIIIVDDLYAFFEGRPSITGWLVEKAKAGWDVFKGWLSSAFAWLMEAFENLWAPIAIGWGEFWDYLSSIAGQAWNALAGWVAGAVHSLSQKITEAFNAVSTFFAPWVESLKSIFTTFWDFLAAGWGAIGNAIKVAFTAAFDFIASKFNWLSEKWEGIIETLNSVNGKSIFGDRSGGSNLKKPTLSTEPGLVPAGGIPAAGMAGISNPLPPAVGVGISNLSSPGLSGGLSNSLTDARSTTRSNISNSSKQTLNAPINITVNGGTGASGAKDIAAEVKRELTNFTQSAAQGSRPVFSQ